MAGTEKQAAWRPVTRTSGQTSAHAIGHRAPCRAHSPHVPPAFSPDADTPTPMHQLRKAARRRAQQQLEGRLESAYSRVLELESQLHGAQLDSSSSSEGELAHAPSLPPEITGPLPIHAPTSTAVVFDLYGDSGPTVSVTKLELYWERQQHKHLLRSCFSGWRDMHAALKQDASCVSHTKQTDALTACVDGSTQGADYPSPLVFRSWMLGRWQRFFDWQQVPYMQFFFAHWLAAIRRRDAATQPMHLMDTNLACTVLQSPVDVVHFVVIMALGALHQTVLQHLTLHHNLTQTPMPSHHHLSWKLLLIVHPVFNAWSRSISAATPSFGVKLLLAMFSYAQRLAATAFAHWYAAFFAIDGEHENNMQTLILETLDAEFTYGRGKGLPVGTYLWPFHAPSVFIDLAYFAFRCEFTGMDPLTDPYALTYAQAKHLWASLWRIIHVASQRPVLHSVFGRAIRDTDALDFAQHYSLPTSPPAQWWQAAGDSARLNDRAPLATDPEL